MHVTGLKKGWLRCARIEIPDYITTLVHFLCTQACKHKWVNSGPVKHVWASTEAVGLQRGIGGWVGNCSQMSHLACS